jgi:hypothetical protein
MAKTQEEKQRESLQEIYALGRSFHNEQKLVTSQEEIIKRLVIEREKYRGELESRILRILDFESSNLDDLSTFLLSKPFMPYEKHEQTIYVVAQLITEALLCEASYHKEEFVFMGPKSEENLLKDWALYGEQLQTICNNFFGVRAEFRNKGGTNPPAIEFQRITEE